MASAAVMERDKASSSLVLPKSLPRSLRLLSCANVSPILGV